MRRWKLLVGAVAAVAIGVTLTFGAVALAESLYWTAPTKWVSGDTISASDKATFTYYVRVDKPLPGQTGRDGWYYLGETRNGTLSFPADNSLSSLMRSYGFGGQTVNFTVSAAFKDTDGVERDSAMSAPYAWIVPIPFVPRTPVAPPGLEIR